MRPSRPRPAAPQKPLVEVAILGDGERHPAARRSSAKSASARRPTSNAIGATPKRPRALLPPTVIVRTGDIGYLDEDGYLFIVDRKKEIIIRGGENISAAEVEAECYACPAVAEVVGVRRSRRAAWRSADRDRPLARTASSLREASCAPSSTASSQSSKSPSGSSFPTSRCRVSAPARSTAAR